MRSRPWREAAERDEGTSGIAAERSTGLETVGAAPQAIAPGDRVRWTSVLTRCS
jgi:hypothetical protein